jgi:hypothetical protein
MPKVKAAEVVYPEIIVEKYLGPGAMNHTQAREFVGWQELEEPDDACIPELYKLIGKHIRLNRNTNNRPLVESGIRMLRQEHLNKRWRFNAVSIVIGENGNVQDGQYRLLSLICAWEEWNLVARWKKKWPGEQGPTMECIVVKGVSEDDETFKTLNRSRPGSLTDVLFRSHFLADDSPADRKVLGRLADACLKLLWQRTGLSQDTWTPYLTHGEAFECLERHPRLWDCIRFIKSENVDGLSGIINPGFLAAMMYLMGCSGTTDAEEYRRVRRLDAPYNLEKRLSFDTPCGVRGKDSPDTWTRAHDFVREFVKLQTPSSPFYILRGILSPPTKDAPGGKYYFGADGGSLAERLALVCKAWHLYRKGLPLTADGLSLEHAVEKLGDGREVAGAMNDTVTLGGIDLGMPRAKEEPVKEEEEATTPQPATQAGAAGATRQPPETPPVKKGQKVPEGATPQEEREIRERVEKDAQKRKEAQEREAGERRRGREEQRDELLRRRQKEKEEEEKKLDELVTGMRKKHPGKVLFFDGGAGVISAFQEDARDVVRCCHRPEKPLMASGVDGEMPRVSFPREDLEGNTRRIQESGFHVVNLTLSGDTWEATIPAEMSDAPQ